MSTPNDTTRKHPRTLTEAFGCGRDAPIFSSQPEPWDAWDWAITTLAVLVTVGVIVCINMGVM